MKGEHIVWFDVETTGVSISTDRIIEICMVKTDLSGKEVDRFYSLVNPEGMPSRQEALALHGIQDADLLDKPTFKQLAPGISAFMADHDLGGYNIMYFDLPLLVEEMMRAGHIFQWRQRRIIDPFLIQVKYEPRDLGSTYRRMTGKELEGAHGAEADVLATAEIFAAQLQQYPMPTEIEEIDRTVINDRAAMVDLAGKFKLAEVGGRQEVIFNFGKWKGETFRRVYEQDMRYLDWMIDKGEFTIETRVIAKKLLNRMRAERLEGV